MRVLFLTLYPEAAASPRYRVHQFLPHLHAAGMETTVQSAVSGAVWQRYRGPSRPQSAAGYHLHETRRRVQQLLLARSYDVVFLQKGIMSAYLKGMPRLLDTLSSKLVVDIDDAVHLAPPHALGGRWQFLEDRNQLDAVFRRADRVLAGNAWLADAARDHGAARVDHFPTVVDTTRFVPASVQPEEFCVGWIGSPSTTKMLHGIAEVLDEEQVLLVGADATARSFRAKVLPWTYDSEVAMVQRFSVGVLPQQKTAWERGKCALKALLYMACGVPCIATPFGAVRDIITHGENGLLADTPDEWRAALARLRDPQERDRMGAAARATVEAQYALNVAAPRLVQLLRETV